MTGKTWIRDPKTGEKTVGDSRPKPKAVEPEPKVTRRDPS